MFQSRQSHEIFIETTTQQLPSPKPMGTIINVVMGEKNKTETQKLKTKLSKRR